MFFQFGSLHVLAHAERFGQRGALMGCKVGERQRTAPARERMVLADMGADRRDPRIMRAQPDIVRRLEGKADMRQVFEDMPYRFIGAGHLDAVGHVGMLAQESLQHGLEHQVDEALAEYQFHMALLGVLQIVDLGQEGIAQILLAPREQRQQPSGIGGHDAAPSALQQRHAQVLLQPGHGPTHHRRIDLQHVGGAAHRARLDDLQQAQRPLAVQHMLHDASPPCCPPPHSHSDARAPVFLMLPFIQRFTSIIVMDAGRPRKQNGAHHSNRLPP